MPTETKRRGVLRWRATVKQEGKIVATRWFGAGEKERRRAIIWEESKKKELEEEARKKTQIPTESLTLRKWTNVHLNDIKRRHSNKTYLEKCAAFRRLAGFVRRSLRQAAPHDTQEHDQAGDFELTVLTPAFALSLLQHRHDTQSGYAANKDRKNLGKAWEWGRKFIDGFPNMANPFYAVERFKEERKPRYVPPVEDFDKVLEVAEGQDKVMLTTFINLAARRGEVFRLQWSDVNFRDGVIRLTTGKTRDGSVRADFIPMSEELKRLLLQWWQERPVQTEYVFTMLENAHAAKRKPGDPFTSRCHFMRRICKRANVKQFDFHSIRHLSAVILYKAGEPLSKIQKILRHQDATTTNRYLKSLGFDIEEIRGSVEALRRGPAKVIPLPTKAETL